MIKLIDDKVLYQKGNLSLLGKDVPSPVSGRQATIAAGILRAHNTSGHDTQLKIKFDGLASHDITYVGIVQTARASGLERFPLPYVMTNCHNSLCAVGGTINEDDHNFGLSAAKKYGGIYVPAHLAVIHQYMREKMAGCGRMLLGSDSHTRYGALGTMGVGEGGPELVKQLLSRTYDISAPDVVAIYLEGEPQPGVGPQDVALALISAVFEKGFVKNKVLEFIGPGVAGLSVDFRNGIDVMTTETTCLSSVWATDEKVREYFEIHGRPEAYRALSPGEGACYDGAVMIDLSTVEPMIALPFHPSNAFTIRELCARPAEILAEVEKNAKNVLERANSFSLRDKIINGRLHVDQGVIAGCAGGTFENIMEAAALLENHSTGNGYFSLSVYPASQPIYMELVKNGAAASLMSAGAVIKTAFCGPCFGAGDVPSNNGLSIRHTTRNFPSREGSKPGNGQIASVALMDARSIAATAAMGGVLTPATEVCRRFTVPVYRFDNSIYEKRVYDGFGRPDKDTDLRFGPNIVDWPPLCSLTDHLALRVVTVINDPVTTTDELIPSGETSSYRSNPLGLAEFTLSRKDPGYVGRAKEVRVLEQAREEGRNNAGLEALYTACTKASGLNVNAANTGVGSTIYAVKPGDGSAREQAASCQRVLSGWANVAREYATKRYRSNLINWGMLPFTLADPADGVFSVGDILFIPNLRAALEQNTGRADAYVLSAGNVRKIILLFEGLTPDERDIILAGCLINYYAEK